MNLMTTSVVHWTEKALFAVNVLMDLVLQSSLMDTSEPTALEPGTYDIPLYLVTEFVPVTVLYFIVLLLQIKIITLPMPCFIMFAQLVFLRLNFIRYYLSKAFFNHVGFRKEIILSTFYGLFSLNSFQQILAPFFVSVKIKFIHLAFFDSVSSIYLIFLIFLTGSYKYWIAWP